MRATLEGVFLHLGEKKKKGFEEEDLLRLRRGKEEGKTNSTESLYESLVYISARTGRGKGGERQSMGGKKSRCERAGGERRRDLL